MQRRGIMDKDIERFLDAFSTELEFNYEEFLSWLGDRKAEVEPQAAQPGGGSLPDGGA